MNLENLWKERLVTLAAALGESIRQLRDSDGLYHNHPALAALPAKTSRFLQEGARRIVALAAQCGHSLVYRRPRI